MVALSLRCWSLALVNVFHLSETLRKDGKGVSFPEIGKGELYCF